MKLLVNNGADMNAVNTLGMMMRLNTDKLSYFRIWTEY